MHFLRYLLALGLILIPVSAQTASPGATNLTPLEPTVPPLPNTAFELKAQVNRPLKLQDAIALALARSPQLALAQLAIERGEAGVRGAEAGLSPTASFSATSTYSQSAAARASSSGATFVNTSGTNTGGFSNSTESAPLTSQVSLNWRVYSGGLVSGQIRTAAQSLQSTRLDYERIRQDLISSIITAYYDLQTADGNLTIGAASVRSAEATLRDAQAQLTAGTGTRFAVLQANVQLANAVQQNLQFQNNQRVSQQNLARLLNFERPTEVRAEDPVARGEDWQMGLEESILQAFRQRVELNQQLALEGVARGQEEAAYGNIHPQVSLFVNGEAYDNFLDRVSGIYTGYSAGVQVTWNIFDGGAARALADQAITDAKSARVRYVDILNSVRFGVESAFSQLQTSNERIATNNTAVVSAEEGLVLARLRLEAGVGTQTDVLIADRDLTQARVNQLNSIVDYNRALAALRRALGIL